MKNLRQQLHNIPEPSMQEKNTKKALIEFLQAETDLKIVDCGSWFYAWKKGVNKTAQGAIAFRADMDAAYPENGRNPSETLARLILEVENITREFQRQGKIVRMTVIGVEIGSNSYGMSASEGEVRFTVRAEKEAEFESYLKEIRKMAEGMARKGGFTLEMEEIERFPATENHAKEVEKVRGVAQKLGLQTMELPEPMRWSEDFGYYLRECKGAFFGMGDGEEYPQLHTAEYEFPDEIIEYAIMLFFTLSIEERSVLS